MREKEATSCWNPSNLIDVHCGWAQTKGNGLLQQQPNLEPNVATVSWVQWVDFCCVEK